MTNSPDRDLDATSRSTEEDTSSTMGQLLAEQLDSRRQFLQKAGAIGVGSLLTAGGASAQSIAFQQGEDSGGGSGGSGPPDAPVTLQYLRYALTLEQLEATFYANALERLSDSELRNAEILSSDNSELNEGVPERIRTINQHEQAHVAALSAVVEALGGDPSQQFEFAFPYDSASGFLRIARTLENTGVSAYDGALAFVGNNLGALGSTLLQTAGATIATVEARHASYLNELTGTNPFPTTFDEPQSMDSILAKASPFVVGFKDERERFLVQVENVSTKSTYALPEGSTAVPLSPGAYAIHHDENPVYTPGSKADAGLERIAEDGFPFMKAGSLAGMEPVVESGVFASHSQFPPGITPGETGQFFVTAHPDDKLSLATMFVPSNDLFIGPDNAGISLFENGDPVSGDVTDQLTLYDAGTEVDQEGVGSFAKPNQGLLATDVGDSEDEPIRPAGEANEFEYPALSEVLKVTVTPQPVGGSMDSSGGTANGDGAANGGNGKAKQGDSG